MTAKPRVPAEPPILTVARKAYRDERATTEARQAQAQQREADREQAQQALAMTRVQQSPLPGWFPGQDWTYIGRVPNGGTPGTVVRATGTDLLFVIVGVGPSWTVSLVRADLQPGHTDWLMRARRMDGPAAVGREIELRSAPAQAVS